MVGTSIYNMLCLQLWFCIQLATPILSDPAIRKLSGWLLQIRCEAGTVCYLLRCLLGGNVVFKIFK